MMMIPSLVQMLDARAEEKRETRISYLILRRADALSLQQYNCTKNNSEGKGQVR